MTDSPSTETRGWTPVSTPPTEIPVEDAAAWAGVSEWSLRERLRRGTLKGRKVPASDLGPGRERWLVSASDLAAAYPRRAAVAGVPRRPYGGSGGSPPPTAGGPPEASHPEATPGYARPYGSPTEATEAPPTEAPEGRRTRTPPLVVEARGRLAEKVRGLRA